MYHLQIGDNRGILLGPHICILFFILPCVYVYCTFSSRYPALSSIKVIADVSVCLSFACAITWICITCWSFASSVPFGQPRSYCHLLHASAHFGTSLSLPPSPVSLEFFLFLISFPGDLLSISLLVPIYEFKLISRIVSMKRVLPQFVGASQCLRDHWLDITASAYYALPEIWQVLC